MIRPPEAALLVLFVAWALVSIVGQHRSRFSIWLRSWDLFGLVPTWTFFAPNPVSHDHYLYYRDYSFASVGPWHRAFDADVRTWWDPLWNPLRREEKAISDAMFHLLDQAREVDATRIQFSISYLTILSFVSSLPRENDVIARQFLFAVRRANDVPRPVFLSNIHVLEDNPSTGASRVSNFSS
jgi:hypothetical protein